MVSILLIFQNHLSFSDLYNHKKANGSTETNIIISWLTGEVSIISDHQIAQCDLPDFRKLFKDEQILNIILRVYIKFIMITKKKNITYCLVC